MANPLRNRYDIIINGGGIVGFTFLKLILRSPYLNRCKVLLLEQATRPENLQQPVRHLEEVSASELNEKTNSNHHDSKKFSNRVSSITPASISTFKRLGIWDSVKPYTKDIRGIQVWNYDYSHKLNFKQNQSLKHLGKEEQDVMFSVLENNRLSLALLEAIHKHDVANDIIRWGYTLQHLGQSSEHGLIEVVAKDTQTGEEIVANAPLVLGCDGFKSKVREFARVKYTEISLDKTAVVGTVKMSMVSDRTNANDIAFQKFSSEKDTVAALLPLDKEYSSFVISAPNEYARHLMDCDNDLFIKEFNLLLTSKESPNNAILKGLHSMSNLALGNIHGFLRTLSPSFDNTNNLNSCTFDECPSLDSVVEGSRASFPLIFGTTSPKMIASLPGKSYPQLALLGDSSHRVHPLAGQGLNLGIQDAQELAKQLESKATYGERIFSETDLSNLSKALKIYECKRQAYIVPMSAGILAMPHLFKLMPSELIASVNRCAPIKSASVRFANGINI